MDQVVRSRCLLRKLASALLIPHPWRGCAKCLDGEKRQVLLRKRLLRKPLFEEWLWHQKRARVGGATSG